MDTQKKKEFTYFQYYKDLKIPIYIKLSLAEFEPGIVEFLNEICFSQISSNDVKKIEEEISKNSKAKILRLTEASPSVANNIMFFKEGDSYGKESVSLGHNYKIYRYQGIAVQVFSSSSQEWELGCFSDFGTGDERFAYVTIINRFLSWSLAQAGIVGFWGVPVDEGVVIMGQQEAKGEAVFFDIYKNTVFTLDGVKKVNASFVIMRLDRTLKGRNIKMNSAELLSFLTVNCCYFDFNGLSVPVRQMIRKISGSIRGLIHPSENFKPRTDLSV